jgi:hypothetical protein
LYGKFRHFQNLQFAGSDAAKLIDDQSPNISSSGTDITAALSPSFQSCLP